jgi:hypothetical protein
MSWGSRFGIFNELMYFLPAIPANGIVPAVRNAISIWASHRQRMSAIAVFFTPKNF